jgi:hypothetical protein
MRKQTISFLNTIKFAISAILCYALPYRLVKHFLRDAELEASILHPRTFGYLKNRCEGKKIVIVAAGPTVKDYVPIKDAMHIGINRAFLLDKVKFDALVCSDYRGIESVADDFVKYEEDTCLKFIDFRTVKKASFPSDFPNRIKHLRAYVKKGTPSLKNMKINKELDKYPLWTGNTTAIQAMQIALWMNPKQIYLVGCDCSVGIKYRKPLYFVDVKRDSAVDRNPENEEFARNYGDYEDVLIYAWKRIKLFAEEHYPETEIISINPVGLKGVFKEFLP